MRRLFLLALLVGIATSIVPAYAQQNILHKSLNCVETNPTVTNASTTILAGSGDHRIITIQNNHATGIVYINFDVAATTANYRIVAAGGVYTQATGASMQNITAIGSVASNTDVSVIACGQ